MSMNGGGIRVSTRSVPIRPLVERADATSAHPAGLTTLKPGLLGNAPDVLATGEPTRGPERL